MTVRRLTPKHPLRAPNFINAQAETRVFEMAEVTKELQRNAISVHGTRCIYFKKILHGHTCSCHIKQNGTRTTAIDGTDIVQVSRSQQSEGRAGFKVDIEYTDPLFVREQAPDSLELQTDIEEEGEFDINGSELFNNTLFGDSIDCGVCYRTGHIPGYVPLGHSRYVWHTHNVSQISGYVIDDDENPSAFSQKSEDGFVEFLLQVPTRFLDVTYAVYNNRDKLAAPLIFKGRQLRRSDLTNKKELLFRVQNIPDFTHVVIQFRLVQSPILIDFPQNQKDLDLAMFDNFGNVTLITSDTVPTADSGDVVLNLDKNSLWKITDYSYYELRDGNSLGWNLTARLIQKDETLGNISTLWSLPV